MMDKKSAQCNDKQNNHLSKGASAPVTRKTVAHLKGGETGNIKAKGPKR